MLKYYLFIMKTVQITGCTSVFPVAVVILIATGVAVFFAIRFIIRSFIIR